MRKGVYSIKNDTLQVPSKIVQRIGRFFKQVFLFLITFLFAFVGKKKLEVFTFTCAGSLRETTRLEGLIVFSSVMVRVPFLSFIICR